MSLGRFLERVLRQAQCDEVLDWKAKLLVKYEIIAINIIGA